MSREQVTAQKMLELLNEVLREQKGYRPEMEFLASPPGSSGVGIWGTDTSTPYTESDTYRDAERIVHEMYEFDPHKE
ncbi:hypothetical protein [Variovorax sp. 38R]|uniref:hypothetical protein n=1 Tax=Variovorax sp. 38R TaxID=2774875 RepID=UPI0017801B4C|nr:hypothetical protein [Variovorax sp. 38R]QOF80313.1 hypothetical protein IG196_07970 [Variovorax sp. 38R]